MPRSSACSRQPATRCSPQTQTRLPIIMAGSSGEYSYCRTPTETCMTTSPIGGVDRHMQRLPDRGRQEIQPEIMAGGRHQEHDDERAEPQNLERKADELEIVRPLRQLAPQARQAVLSRDTTRSSATHAPARRETSARRNAGGCRVAAGSACSSRASGPMHRITVSIRKAQQPRARTQMSIASGRFFGGLTTQ